MFHIASDAAAPSTWMSHTPDYARYNPDKPLSPRSLSLTKTAARVESSQGEYETEAGTRRLTANNGKNGSDVINDLSHLNLKGLDDVIQELRNVNDDVCASVEAAGRSRRSHALNNAASGGGVGMVMTAQRDQ